LVSYHHVCWDLRRVRREAGYTFLQAEAPKSRGRSGSSGRGLGMEGALGGLDACESASESARCLYWGGSGSSGVGLEGAL
ncbi:hypothetical protein FOA52_009355, partial [Chlamydomonas sp. UWO 241]